MNRIAIFSVLAAAAAALSIPSAAQPSTGSTIIAPPTVGAIKQEPILLYDVTGSTLAGTIHVQLSVYNNGLASASKLNQLVFPSPGVDVDVDLAHITPQELNKLRRDLAAAGAFTNVDQNIWVSDVPTTTVTVFRGNTDADAHTYSYLIGSGPQADVQDVINEFMALHFPTY